MIVPEYIERKIDSVNKFIDRANILKYEIIKWAEDNGADTDSEAWYESVIDETDVVSGIWKEGLRDYMETI